MWEAGRRKRTQDWLTLAVNSVSDFFFFFLVLKCQTTDVVDVCLCWYLWRFLAACLYTWQSVCSLQADIWNHLAICRLNYVNTLPLCQHFAIKSTLCNYVNTLRRHQFSDSSNVLVSFSRSISWTGNFAHTVHLFFPRVLCVVSCKRRTKCMLNGDRSVNEPSTCKQNCGCILIEAWTYLRVSCLTFEHECT